MKPDNLDARAPLFTLAADEDEKTGKWHMDCPFCELTVEAYTAVGASEQMVAHLNEQHEEEGKRAGRA